MKDDEKKDTGEKEKEEGKGAHEKDTDATERGAHLVRTEEAALKKDTLGALASELGLQLSDTALDKLSAVPYKICKPGGYQFEPLFDEMCKEARVTRALLDKKMRGVALTAAEEQQLSRSLGR